MRHGVASFQGADEVADEQVGQDRVAARDHVVGALDDDERRAGELRQAVGPGQRLAVVLGAVDEEHRAAHGPAGRLDRREVDRKPALASAIIASTEPSSAQPTASSIGLVECGSG